MEQHFEPTGVLIWCEMQIEEGGQKEKTIAVVSASAVTGH